MCDNTPVRKMSCDECNDNGEWSETTIDTTLDATLYLYTSDDDESISTTDIDEVDEVDNLTTPTPPNSPCTIDDIRGREPPPLIRLPRPDGLFQNEISDMSNEISDMSNLLETFDAEASDDESMSIE